MLSVNLGVINNIQVPGGKSVLVPLTGLDSNGGPVSYSFSASDSNVQLSLVSPTSKSISLNVTGTDNTNTPFSGTIVLHLFEDLAPQTTARIEQLVTQGYYNGLDFFRVLDGFVAQTGKSNNGNDTGVLLDDELNSSLTFTSPGLLAMANRGSDTADAEFFITAIDSAGSTSPIALSDMPQSLNFRYTIFGQVVSGFDTFEKIMSTTVAAQPDPGFNGEVSHPTATITVTSAQVIDDTQDAVLRVFAPASFDGSSATITVTATNSVNETAQQTFTAAAVTDTQTDPPFLGPIGNQTTPTGVPAQFTLTSTNLSGGNVFYDMAAMSNPANATLNIDHTTGIATVTPNPGFSGAIQIIVGVRSDTSNFDTQVITVNVVHPTLTSFPDQTTAVGVPLNLDLTSTDPTGNGVVYRVFDPNTLGPPANLSVSIDQATGHVVLTPAPGFSGSIDLVAAVADAASPDIPSNYTGETFTLNVVAPTLDAVADQTTVVGLPDAFTLHSTDGLGNGVAYSVVDASTLAAPDHVTVGIDQATGQVTITPEPGFSGSLNLLARVIDVTSPNVPENYTTQAFTLNVVAPSLDPVGDQTSAVGSSVNFTLTSNDSLGNVVTYSIVDVNTLGTPDHVTTNIDQATGQVILSPEPGFNGTLHLLARVIDVTSPDDPANYVTQEFTLAFVAPTLDPVGNQTAVVGVPVTLDLQSTDALGNGVAYSVVDASTLAAPDHVTVGIDQVTGQVTITPEPGFSGSLNLLARVIDVTSPNVPENYTTQAFTLTVVALDPVADQNTGVGAPVTFTLVASPSGGDVFYTIVDANTFTAPDHVTVTIDQTTGQVTLKPEAGFSGTLNLLAGVRSASSDDVQGNYLTRAFTFSIVAPTLNPVSDQTTAEGVPVSFDAVGADPTGGGVFYTVVDANTFAAPTDVSVDINQTTGDVTLKPNAGFTGSVNLLVGVRTAASDDVEANYTTQAFTLDVLAPTLGTVANQTTAVGVADNLTLSSTDPTGGGVFYAIVDPNTLGIPAHVTVTVDQTTGHVTLKPEAGFSGTINLRAEVRALGSDDVPANYVTQDFSLNVLAPSLLTVSNQTGTLGAPRAFNLSGIDFTGGNVIFTVVDPATFAAPAHVTVTINQTTGLVTLQPDAGFAGTINLLAGVRAAGSDDVQANYTTQAFTFSLVAPTLNTVNNLVTTVDTATSFTIGSTNSGGDPVVYSIVDPATMLAPAHVSINIDQVTGLVTLMPDAGFAGTINLLARVRALGSTDVPGNYVTQGFTLTVDTVTVNSINNIQVPGGKSVLVPLTGVDAAGNPITYTVSSSDPNVTVSLVSPTSKSLVLNVTGTDKNGNAFSGQLVLHLFEDLAPQTTARIEQLVAQGYYNGLDFFRVLDGFVAQTGNNGSGDTGVLLNDEFNTSLTFTSPGLLAMANRGRDTADAEFFITAIDAAGSTAPISLANMPQFLDFRYTIFGQLVSGFDTFEKIMSTNVAASSQIPGETSSPTQPITVTSAQLITDTQNAVLKITAPASFNGSSATITVTGTNSTGQTSQQTFSAAAVADTQSDPPFLGTVSNQTTTAGTSVTFTLTSTDLSAGGVFYKIGDPTSFGTPANVTVSISQATGQVTLTPAAGFTGTINLLAGVRASSATDTSANYDTQAFTLTVNPSDNTGAAPAAPTGLGVDVSSNTGAFDGNGYVSVNNPKLTVTAVTGATVQFKLNGVVIATATETATGSGQYTATLPAGKLGIGANAVTAIVTNTNGTSVDSTAMSLIYAPDFASGIYVVPGAPGTTQTLAFVWASRNAAYNDEVGYFIADSTDGSINGIAPGEAGYAKAALSSGTRKIIFGKGEKAGAAANISLQGGQILVFYMIQNNTTANFLSKNPSNANHGNSNSSAPLAFFSIKNANPDGMKHTQIVADPTTGRAQYNWEDLMNLGDSDFNDVVMTVRLANQSGKPPATVHAPGTGDKNVTLKGTLHGGHLNSPPGDVGVFFVDNPDGSIGSLHPGDPGYLAAALASGNFRVLFAAGAAVGSQQVTVPAGKYLAFYSITTGATANFLTANPSNSTSGGPVAILSFDAADPNGINHFRWYSPGQQATDPNVQQLHIMDKIFGSASDFDDFTIDLSFSA
jgi:cyclophilin family peptidyl-prolyl cis-trans isomerase